jgi:hypothetical protein
MIRKVIRSLLDDGSTLMTTTDESGTIAVVIPDTGARARFRYPSTGGCFALGHGNEVIDMIHGTAELCLPPDPVMAHEEARALHSYSDGTKAGVQ